MLCLIQAYRIYSTQIHYRHLKSKTRGPIYIQGESHPAAFSRFGYSVAKIRLKFNNITSWTATLHFRIETQSSSQCWRHNRRGGGNLGICMHISLTTSDALFDNIWRLSASITSSAGDTHIVGRILSLTFCMLHDLRRVVITRSNIGFRGHRLLQSVHRRPDGNNTATYAACVRIIAMSSYLSRCSYTVPKAAVSSDIALCLRLRSQIAVERNDSSSCV